MLRRRFKLFGLFGIRLRVDMTWLPLSALLIWTNGQVIFPVLVPGLAEAAYWVLAVLGALGLFLSVLLREVGRAVVAQAFGPRLAGITLFVFGGVPETPDGKAAAPRDELTLLAYGLFTGFALGLGFFLFLALAAGMMAALVPAALLFYLAAANLALTAVALLPVHPLDGGRLLRAVLESWRMDSRKASRIAVYTATALSLALAVLGLVFVVQGGFLAALWLLLGGMLFYRARSVALP
ncbi:site-2 protease family protein [Telmatospirillum sp. J64-1]|uniref:site-2 protease family protein n=1 Tax=Telmatospirillum sp. J64-1 TaxID=2502183 RepID=UPI00115DD265|nr:site-2 protease family protein [Telmatospirillum sp. J64-1]